ncbi:glycosyltransferase family 4 protein [Serinicoccus chungangensis]|uniref:glycosyltransferase family 4 protein n=1 Tax=Serinicoccus chungangensis TaxID=767452 RepID=UPI0011194777|nr:glycosyltransferase family 4 protein [Serinicoccus chungangensis]
MSEQLTSKEAVLQEERARAARRVGGLSDARSSLEQLNLDLRGHLDVSKQRLAAMRARAERAEQRAERAEQRAQAQREQRLKQIEQAQVVKKQFAAFKELTAERREKLLGSLTSTRERLAATTELWTVARRYYALFRQGLLYDEIAKSDVDLAADTYLCLLPSTVPAALVLSRKFGGRVICDCVENVEVHRHSLAPNLSPAALEMVNTTAYGALAQCDGLMTVSSSVATTLERFGPPVRLQPNYRRLESPAPSGTLRDRCGVGEDATILITTGNVVEGFETLVDALALLPDSFHLVALVRLSPAAYEERVREHISRRGMTARVHLLGFAPYDELPGLLMDADLGIIMLDPGNANHSVALPNRVFDFVTSVLPFVAPPLPEFEAFVTEHRCGSITHDLTPEGWAKEIASALTHTSARRSAAHVARQSLTWESQEEALVHFLGEPGSVTMLGFRDLTRYQRFLRIAQTLGTRGTQVKAVFFSENPAEVNIPNTEFFYFSDRYGRGSGLQRLHSHD